MLPLAEAIGLFLLVLFLMEAFDRYWQSRKRPHYPPTRENRRTPRYAIHCPVVYHMGPEVGQGVAVDVSRNGWRVRGSRSPSVGTALSLDLSVESLPQPIHVAQAVVRWSSGQEFGLQLMALDSLPAVQLSEWLSRIEQTGPRREAPDLQQPAA